MANVEPLDGVFMDRTVEAAIRIAVIAALVGWCFVIARPFLVPVIWGAIIAITVFRGYRMLEVALGDRPTLAGVLTTFLLLVVLVVPSILLGNSLVTGVNTLVDSFQSGKFSLPPPPDGVARWPLVGEPISRVWTAASQDLGQALHQASPLLKYLGSWLLRFAQGAGIAILQLVLAICISGAFLVHSTAAARVARAVAYRLAGERGLTLVDVAEKTVRSVASGILGVAVIQAVLAGLGFLLAGIPAAGLLTLICLLSGVVQLGVVIVLIPATIYLFATAETAVAVGFLLWAIVIAPIDNILKPLLLGRGVDVPTLVIFVGAIGGFLSSGIVGLFLGAVVLALGYTLFLAWLQDDETTAGHVSPPRAPDHLDDGRRLRE